MYTGSIVMTIADELLFWSICHDRSDSILVLTSHRNFLQVGSVEWDVEISDDILDRLDKCWGTFIWSLSLGGSSILRKEGGKC